MLPSHTKYPTPAVSSTQVSLPVQSPVVSHSEHRSELQNPETHSVPAVHASPSAPRVLSSHTKYPTPAVSSTQVSLPVQSPASSHSEHTSELQNPEAQSAPSVQASPKAPSPPSHTKYPTPAVSSAQVCAPGQSPASSHSEHTSELQNPEAQSAPSAQSSPSSPNTSLVSTHTSPRNSTSRHSYPAGHESVPAGSQVSEQ